MKVSVIIPCFNEEKTLKKIWTIKQNVQADNEIEIKAINLKDGYLLLLEEIGKNNVLINEYYKSIEIAGDISPYNVDLFKFREKELQINDKTLRFILAVHYLSINKGLLNK